MRIPFLPMLAARGEPFDSPEHLFEVKWNGVRALAAIEQGQWLLWGRDLADYRPRYPELAILSRLPAGTVLDGELVLLHQGVPNLEALLARHQLLDPAKLRHVSRDRPITYVVFDALYRQGRCLFGEPLQARREVLQRLLDGLHEPRLCLSEGVVGSGQAFFEEAVRQGQEGVVAKHVASRYLPGKRSAAWRKIKPARTLPCVIIGFVPGRPGRRGFRSLLVAASVRGRLSYVANVCSGFSGPVRAQLPPLLARRVRSQPVASCPHRGIWVEPDLYCQVRFLEWTRGGRLRGASFQRLLEAPVAEPELPVADQA